MARQPPQDCIEHLKKRGFLIDEWVGGGAYGNVYKAKQVSFGRPVAIKFFDNPFSRGENNRKRFEREAPLLARVEHPSVPYVITSGEVATREGPKIPFTVMQFIDGPSLQLRLQNRISIEPSEVRRIMKNLLGALSAAHKLNVVHRDVKPDNIIISEYATFLIDFSIGVVLHQERGLTRATASGERVGTWDYAAPEQKIDASSVTHKADIYSAGVVLAEMLGAKVPLRLDTLDAELREVPPALLSIVKRAAADKIDDRYSDAQDFFFELDQVLRQQRNLVDNQTDQADSRRLTDGDVILMGTIAMACQLPGSHTTDSHVAGAVKSVLPGLGISIAFRRLSRLGLIETIEVSESYGDYMGLRLTEKGEEWIETHQKRASVLLGVVTPVEPPEPDFGDDIPF